MLIEPFPHFCGEVCGAGGGLGGVPVEVYAPDGALVALERADPVPGVALSQHRLAILKKSIEN